jgi:hypothetical protein
MKRIIYTGDLEYPQLSGVDSVAALPPDVRKGFALPAGLINSGATPPGHSPDKWEHVTEGRSPSAHQAAEPRRGRFAVN